ILELGANINAKSISGHTALLWAVVGQDLYMANWYLEACADIGTEVTGGTTLSLAAYRGRLPILNSLLEAGAFVSTTSSRDGHTPLSVAAKCHLNLVDRLLDAGADVNVKDRYRLSSLSKAVGKDDLSTVNRLLEAGAGEHTTAFIVALSMAASCRYLAVFNRLL
ncbi:ankyrin repeat-containing domain protein, partial [Morchella snyderi]